MKIRQGFVSNSSSTSFCIYGIYLDAIHEEREKLEETADKLGLYCHYGQDEGIYLGRKLADIKDDETAGHFKKETQDIVDKLPITDNEKKCSVITEDGMTDNEQGTKDGDKSQWHRCMVTNHRLCNS